MKITIPYMPIGWNEYINAERGNFYKANKIKQEEKLIVKMATKGLKYEGEYPVSLTVYAHYKDKRRDIDNLRLKGVIDGLVANEVIKNDNLNCIQKITLLPVFDGKELLEIEIKKIET